MEELLSMKMRPNSLKDIIGQKHLVGENKVIYNLVKNKRLFSMILYGNPGIGKTSIAYAISSEFDLNVRFLNATINNKKDFDIVVEEAKMYKGIILIMDEIHRLNKDKQDLLLPYLESGLIILIGLTTSNPYYVINPAIRSRCQIFELKSLSNEDLLSGILKVIEYNYLPSIDIDNDAISYIINISNGDLRFCYNFLEIAYFSSSDKVIDIDFLKSINNNRNIVSDKNGNSHYNLLSAFQKSIRGSDVDASLYYLSKLIINGDFESIYRRLLVIAYEDIGLASINAPSRVFDAIKACEMIGFPEGRIPLSVVVIELCLSPKSNSAYKALDKALMTVENKKEYDIPSYLKSPYNGYKYPHDYSNSYVKQQYLPDELKNEIFYVPNNNKIENGFKKINDKIKEN